LLDDGYRITGTYHLGTTDQNEKFLEGTGSMIIDRQEKVIYGAKSLRTDDHAFKEFCETLGYKGISFDTESSNGKPYYHTNMIMCIGDTFVVICSEGIKAADRQNVLNNLKKFKREIIEITKEQADKHCCGNILQVKSATDATKKYIVMSEKAFKGFTEDQKKKLQKHGEIIYSNIDTIEDIGGGSARCMMCEVYLPKKETVTQPNNHIEKSATKEVPKKATVGHHNTNVAAKKVVATPNTNAIKHPPRDIKKVIGVKHQGTPANAQERKPPVKTKPPVPVQGGPKAKVAKVAKKN